jgi:hypothetical protein
LSPAGDNQSFIVFMDLAQSRVRLSGRHDKPPGLRGLINNILLYLNDVLSGTESAVVYSAAPCCAIQELYDEGICPQI